MVRGANLTNNSKKFLFLQFNERIILLVLNIFGHVQNRKTKLSQLNPRNKSL